MDTLEAARRNLELSRAALAQTMATPAMSSSSARALAAGEEIVRPALAPSPGPMGLVSDALREAWDKSPLRTAVDTGTPLVKNTIRSNPWTSILAAATVGAALVWISPLRRAVVRSSFGLARRSLGAAALASIGWRVYESALMQAQPERDYYDDDIAGA